MVDGRAASEEQRRLGRELVADCRTIFKQVCSAVFVAVRYQQNVCRLRAVAGDENQNGPSGVVSLLQSIFGGSLFTRS